MRQTKVRDDKVAIGSDHCVCPNVGRSAGDRERRGDNMPGKNLRKQAMDRGESEASEVDSARRTSRACCKQSVKQRGDDRNRSQMRAGHPGTQLRTCSANRGVEFLHVHVLGVLVYEKELTNVLRFQVAVYDAHAVNVVESH